MLSGKYNRSRAAGAKYELYYPKPDLEKFDSDTPRIPRTSETVRKVEIEPLVGGRSLRVRGYLSSHLCNLRKSVDESMVRDSDTTHPQITQITRMRDELSTMSTFRTVSEVGGFV